MRAVLFIVTASFIITCGAVDGGWGIWSPWGGCSVTEERGVRQRTRPCNQPAPDLGGRDCIGRRLDMEDCDVIKQSPAFFAYSAVDTLLSGGIPLFRHLDINVGGGYNPSTGKFTCPTSGLYEFSASLGKLSGVFASCELSKNGNTTGVGVIDTMSAIIQADKGDDVYLNNCMNWEYVEYNFYTMFGGKLIAEK